MAKIGKETFKAYEALNNSSAGLNRIDDEQATSFVRLRQITFFIKVNYRAAAISIIYVLIINSLCYRTILSALQTQLALLVDFLPPF